MKQVFLLLGSNSGDRRHYLRRARLLLAERMGTIRKKSEIYETEPWGFDSKQLFLNQAIEIQTSHTPKEILQSISEIEQSLGRTQTIERYASRTLDIDVLLIDNLHIEDPDLQVPHPRMHLRKFALIPLVQIAGKCVHPVFNKDMITLLKECKDPLKVVPSPDPMNKSLSLPYQFICIEGNIGSGKTSLATLLAEQINAKLILERFEDNSFLPKFYEDPEQYAFTLEMSFLTDRYQQLNEALKSGDLFHTKLISDYFIDKSVIFAHQNLNKDQFILFSRMFHILQAILPKPDLIVYLYNDSSSLKNNIVKRGRSYEKRISLNYLNRIQQGYLSYFQMIKKITILIIDIRNIDFVGSYPAFLQLCEYLQKEYPPGIHKITEVRS